ncbi:MAG: serine/threonine-protein kinase [Myxococcota bacterium]
MGEALQHGEMLGPYRILLPLGEGGQGQVYRALGPDGAIVALKHLTDGRRLEVELEVARRVHSPFVARLLHASAEPPLVAYEFIEGEALRSSETRSLAEVCLIADSVLRGLSDLHAAGVLHRDVKPSNVLVCSVADRPPAVLIDLGVAKVGGHRAMTKSGVRIGTPGFAAPEQLDSGTRADERSDIYGAGMLLYRLLSGRFPFDEGSYERMLIGAARHGRTPLREHMPQIPAPLAAVVDRAVRRDPLSRFESAVAMLTALRASMSLGEYASQSKLSVQTLRRT